MLGSIKYNLANVTNFEGRDARQTFWFYVLFLVVAQFLASLVASIPMYITLFTSVVGSVGEGGNPEAMMQSMMGEMVDQVILQSIVGIVLGLIVTAVFVASFARRLHDAGFSGWIAAIPVATQLLSFAFTISFLGQIEVVMKEAMTEAMANPGAPPDMAAMQADTGLFGLIGWVGYLVVIGFGVLKSQDGPNVYGEAPVRF